MIKVAFVTSFSMDHLSTFPSNFSYYITELKNDPRFKVFLINPKDFKGNSIIKTFKIATFIRSLNVDILYLTLWQGYNNLIFAKIMGLFKCKIVIWKYTYCIEGSNFLSKFFFKHIYWPSIDRIYMMYDNHTADALTKKLVRDNQIITVSRGVDIKWYSRYIKESSKDDFYLIATGKDHRDYITLGRACEETKTKCLILTYRHKKCLEAAEIFKNSKYVNFEFIENGYSLTSYCYIVDEVSKASVMAICCDELPYGAGYTNIVECLAFKIP